MFWTIIAAIAVLLAVCGTLYGLTVIALYLSDRRQP